MSLYNELKRRNVLRVAVGYVVVAWLVVQVVETIFPAYGFGDEAIRFVVMAFAIGFIPAVVIAWAFEWTPERASGRTEERRRRRVQRFERYRGRETLGPRGDGSPRDRRRVLRRR